MPYLARFEREAFERGIVIGRRKVLLESIELGLNLRFGREGLALLPKVQELEDLDRLRALQRTTFKARSLEAVKRALRNSRARSRRQRTRL
ncbi:MAG: hypothetical protein HY721_34405 [Planctomycetes bacterium]|nr:hypothetical protein [Planctomycetota bacterium]